jgi:hypothetical protein
VRQQPQPPARSARRSPVSAQTANRASIVRTTA